MSTSSTVILLPGLVTLAAFVGWRMNRIVQPMRVQMVAKADAFLARPNVPESFRLLVQDDVETAFGMRWTIVFGILVVPVIAVVFLFRQRFLRDWIQDYETLPSEDREALREICDLHDRITYVNHFILFPILLLEIGIFMMPAVLLRALLRGTLDSPGTAEVVRNYIEHKRYGHARMSTGFA